MGAHRKAGAAAWLPWLCDPFPGLAGAQRVADTRPAPRAPSRNWRPVLRAPPRPGPCPVCEPGLAWCPWSGRRWDALASRTCRCPYANLWPLKQRYKHHPVGPVRPGRLGQPFFLVKSFRPGTARACTARAAMQRLCDAHPLPLSPPQTLTRS